jgi:hypothetical protein
VNTQRLTHPRVRAGHGYGDRGPVANVPSCGREPLHRTGLGALPRGRQIADHAPRPISQSKLDRPVHILHDITEPAGDLKDHHPTLGAPGDPCLRDRGPTPGRSRRWLAQNAGLEPGRAQDDVVVEICGRVFGTARWLHHDELNSVAPYHRTRATEVQEQHDKTSTPPKVWGGATRDITLITPRIPSLGRGVDLGVDWGVDSQVGSVRPSVTTDAPTDLTHLTQISQTSIQGVRS